MKLPATEIVDLLADSECESEHVQDILEGYTRSDAVEESQLGEIEGGSEGDDSEEWGTESLYEEFLEAGEDHAAVQDSCTAEEALALRKRLRQVGEDQFVAETIEAGKITAKKLCTAFGVPPPTFLEGAPDSAYYPLIGLCISRELSKRLKLSEYNTFDDAVSLLRSAKNIVVLTGAGISTSLGIPDFRSPSTGLYARLGNLGLSDPQEVFDISLFRQDPSIFYSVASEILPSTNAFSPTHAFIRLLQEEGKLLTNFTQNIDNLEGHAGVLPEKMIQCHGSFATATCQECGYQCSGEEIYDEIKAGKIARCTACSQRIERDRRPSGGLLQIKRKLSTSNGRSNSKRRKRREEYEDNTSDEEADLSAPNVVLAGVMKPDITFFGEALPSSFHDRLKSLAAPSTNPPQSNGRHHNQDPIRPMSPSSTTKQPMPSDAKLPDLVLILGTSLKVAPVSEIPGFLPPHIPQIYISREAVRTGHVEFDIDLLGECDIVVEELCRRAGLDLGKWLYKGSKKSWKKSGKRDVVSAENIQGMNGCRDPNSEELEVELELVNGHTSRWNVKTKKRNDTGP